jgi:pimeloyl-ACP methyl ester carboxylesterase
LNLEVLTRAGQEGKSALVFVHGAYVGAWCWDESFLDWFAGRGYSVHALSLRGHGRSEGRESLDDFGLADYAEDVASVVSQLPEAPILIGHSMGALVVQKYLDAGGEAAGVVLACPVPSFGVMPATFALAWTNPRLFAGIQGIATGAGASLEVVAEAMFAGPVDAGRLREVRSRMQRESRRALLDMSGWALPNPWRMQRTRTLVLAAAKDALIPQAHTAATGVMLGAEYRLVEGIGHAIMLDAQWQRAAEAILEWVERLVVPA